MSGAFTSKNEAEVISAAGNVLRGYRHSPGGPPVQFLTQEIYGCIESMQRLNYNGRDVLFIVTTQLRYAVLTFNAAQNCFLPLWKGTVKEPLGHFADNGPLLARSPCQSLTNVVLLHVYHGRLRFLEFPAKSASSMKPYTKIIRIEELNIIDICLLDSGSTNDTITFAILWQDVKGIRHITTYSTTRYFKSQSHSNGVPLGTILSLEDSNEEVQQGPWKWNKLRDPTSNLLIPIPSVSKESMHLVLVLGTSRCAMAWNAGSRIEIDLKFFSSDLLGATCRVWDYITNRQFLVSDSAGNMRIVDINDNILVNPGQAMPANTSNFKTLFIGKVFSLILKNSTHYE